MKQETPPEPQWQEAGGYAFLPAPNEIWHRAPTPCKARYEMVGVPLAFATNAPALAALAGDVFGSEVPSPSDMEKSSLRLDCFLHDVPEIGDAPQGPAPLFRVRGDYLFITRGASFGFADRAAGYAAAFVTPALLQDTLMVQAGFMETLALYQVHRHRPGTLHAAGLVFNDRCVLLAGRSGAGKSTLAYACLRAGFGLLAEDVVYANVEADYVRAWGNPRNIHLLPDTVRFFPELADAEPLRMLNGETKLRVRVEAVRTGASVSQMPVGGVLSLGRAEGVESCLRPADPAYVRHALTYFSADPLVYEEAVQKAVEGVLAGRVAHLDVGADLDHAAALVKQWMAG